MDYNLTLNDQDIQALFAGIGEIPTKVGMPLGNKINGQIQNQLAALSKATPAPAVEYLVAEEPAAVAEA